MSTEPTTQLPALPPLPAPAGSAKCWYCGKPATEHWEIGYTEPPERNAPMCEKCSNHVRDSLALRKQADDLDEAYGIGTKTTVWLPPNAEVSSGAKTP